MCPRRKETNEDGGEGQRSLTHAILKNPGLMPRRSKGVRNPRTKKRQKFAKAKKVIASQKPVFRYRRFDIVWWQALGHLDSREEGSVLVDLQTMRTYDGASPSNITWIRPVPGGLDD